MQKSDAADDEEGIEMVKKRITWQEARDLLLENVKPVEKETVLLAHAAGRILAADVKSAIDVPHFCKSAFDGYAFRSEDTKGLLPVTLQITEEIPAGSAATKNIGKGQAAKILTGAPIPQGADAVCKYEETVFTQDTVIVQKSYDCMENIISAGETFHSGDVIAKKGQRIDAGICGAMASAGIYRVQVYRVPRIGILSTGSELVEAGEALCDGKIVNSNRFTFEAAVKETGCETVYLGIAKDDRASISEAIKKGLETCDAVITTGGASVGDYDLVAESLLKAGANLLCGDLALKPGGKSWYAELQGKLIFGLSGNSASALTNFCAVVAPVLYALKGSFRKTPEYTALLSQEIKKSGPLPRLIRGNVFIEDALAYFRPAQDQKNGAILTMSQMNAMVEIPAGSGPLERGTKVKVYQVKDASSTM